MYFDGSGSVTHCLSGHRISETPSFTADWAILTSKKGACMLLHSDWDCHSLWPRWPPPTTLLQDKGRISIHRCFMVETNPARAAGVFGFSLRLFCALALFSVPNPSARAVQSISKDSRSPKTLGLILFFLPERHSPNTSRLHSCPSITMARGAIKKDDGAFPLKQLIVLGTSDPPPSQWSAATWHCSAGQGKSW